MAARSTTTECSMRAVTTDHSVQLDQECFTGHGDDGGQGGSVGLDCARCAVSLPPWFSRLWALGLSILLLVTFPLWIAGPDASIGYPDVPWFSLPGPLRMIAGVQWIALGLLGFALVFAIINVRARWSWCGVALTLGVLVLFDQHRLQPWVYQSMLYALLLAALPWNQSRRWIIAIMVSIYFYSAAGKLDYQFVHTVGSQLVQALARPIGGVGDRTALVTAFVLPACEMSIAILIAFPRTRRLGGFAAIAMHTTLIALLGPWSLGHSWGVLVWNALLAAQSAWLFVRIPSVQVPEKNADPVAPFWLQWVIRLVVVVALAAPLLERRGYWDHWTSWALYSPHTSRADVQVHRSAIDRLPVGMQAFLVEDDDDDGWQSIDLGRWSLAQRWVPLYPQERYQLLLAYRIADRLQLGQAIRVKARGVSDRWTGRRREAFLIGRNEIFAALEFYDLAPLP